MSKLLLRGSIAIATILCCAYPVPVGAEPPMLNQNPVPELPHFQRVRAMLDRDPELASRVQYLIDHHPDLVAIAVKETLSKHPELVEAIKNDPNLMRAVILANPQIIKSITKNPKLVGQLQELIARSQRQK
jgi:hypothetical protein